METIIIKPTDSIQLDSQHKKIDDLSTIKETQIRFHLENDKVKSVLTNHEGENYSLSRLYITKILYDKMSRCHRNT